MRHIPAPLTALFIAVAFLAGCQGLGTWLDQPAGPNVQQAPGTVTVTDPETGVTVSVPSTPQGAAELDLPDGATATYTPPPPSADPTRGDMIAEVGGGIVGTVMGNPTLAILTTAALRAALGMVSDRKRQPAPVPA